MTWPTLRGKEILQFSDLCHHIAMAPWYQHHFNMAASFRKHTRRKWPNTLVAKISLRPSGVTSSLTLSMSPPVENKWVRLLEEEVMGEGGGKGNSGSFSSPRLAPPSYLIVGGQKAPQFKPVTGIIPALQNSQSTCLYLRTGAWSATTRY